MPNESSSYRAYLLRLWRVNSEAARRTEWRASLEDPRTGERLGFANLEQLFAFLIAWAEQEGQAESRK
jgi:hypothetical protein